VTNKINGLDNRSPPIGAGRAAERTRDAATSAKGESGAGGPVHITSAARHLAALEQHLKELPAVDEARVAAIRLALDRGTYAVVPERIADELMKLDQALAPLYGEP